MMDLKEIKERYNRLSLNVDLIKNKDGKECVKLWINSLKDYLDNPLMDIKHEIDTSRGIRERTFRWIAGDLI